MQVRVDSNIGANASNMDEVPDLRVISLYQIKASGFKESRCWKSEELRAEGARYGYGFMGYDEMKGEFINVQASLTSS